MEKRKNHNIFGNKNTGQKKLSRGQNSGLRQKMAYRQNRSRMLSSYESETESSSSSPASEEELEEYEEGGETPVQSETEEKGIIESTGPQLPLKAKLMIVGIAAGAGILVALFTAIFGGTIETMTPSAIIDECRVVTVVNTIGKLYDGQVEFEDYVAGTVASKAHLTDNVEFYKVSAIESRTKAMQDVGEECVIDEQTSTQKYVDVNTNIYKEQIKEAVQATTGTVLSTDGLIYLDEVKINLDEALILVTEQNYDHQAVLKYYIGEDMMLENASNAYLSNIVNGFSNPVANFVCTSGYGCRYHPIHKYYSMHRGIDLAAQSGEPVYAAKDGVVEYVMDSVPGYSEEYGYGNYINIAHDDGSKTRYAHLLYGSIVSTVYEGARVKQGQMIAKVGSTGASTGPHLHYEIRINGSTVNPYDYIDLTNLSNPSRCNSNASVPMTYCGY